MNNDVLISVIVPVYNIEKYLNRCVDSLINQTYKNLEIILVDDGSTDNCPKICDDYEKKYEAVKVIHKKNGGLSSARNVGIKQASGDYIGFVDSDDWVAADIYRKCKEMMQKYNCDIVDFEVEFVSEEGLPEKINFIESVSLVKGSDIIYDYLYRGQTDKAPFSVCRKLYTRRLFDGISFPEGKINEDIVTNYKVLENADLLLHINEVGYYYFQKNEKSITSGELKKKDFDLLAASRELCAMSEKYEDVRILRLAKIKLARSYFSLLAKSIVGGDSEDISDEDIKYLLKKLRKNYFLLMKSPMPLSRKVLTTAICFNYNLTNSIYHIGKKVNH